MKPALLAPLLFVIPDTMPLVVDTPARLGEGGRFGWPGGYFESSFRGRDVIAKVDPDGEPLRLLVDGALRATVSERGETQVAVSNLSPGVHRVRLEKMTESQSGGPRFLGFFTHGTALPITHRKRRIEFIGDSITVGYGNTSPTRECDSARVRATTDTQLAFGPLAARRLGADYRVIAYSGYGVVRNYAGKVPGENLPFIYDRAAPGDAAVAAPDRTWRPQVIVIHLGTNDFSTALKPGEPWADDAALRAAYRAGYAAFLARLRRAQPQARFVLMAAENFADDVAGIAREAGAAFVRVPKLEVTGCNGHPSLGDHRVMAGLVERAVGPLF